MNINNFNELKKDFNFIYFSSSVLNNLAIYKYNIKNWNYFPEYSKVTINVLFKDLEELGEDQVFKAAYFLYFLSGKRNILSQVKDRMLKNQRIKDGSLKIILNNKKEISDLLEKLWDFPLGFFQYKYKKSNFFNKLNATNVFSVSLKNIFALPTLSDDFNVARLSQLIYIDFYVKNIDLLPKSKKNKLVSKVFASALFNVRLMESK